MSGPSPGISVFRRLLRDEFDEELTELLPGRVIPVSASPPTNLGLLVEGELFQIKGLLANCKRRTAEAGARLRPLLSLDGSATGRTDQPTETEVGCAERALRADADWRKVLPGLASLSIGPATPDGDAQEVVLRVGKSKDAVAVRRARPGEESEALAYRGVSPFEDFSIRLSRFGERLGVTVNEGYAIIEAPKIKDDDRAYLLKLGGAFGRALVMGVFVIGLVGCVLTAVAARTQRQYYAAVRDQMTAFGASLSLGAAAIATTPGARGATLTWPQRFARVQTLIYALLSVTGVADVLGAVYVLARS